MHDLPIETVERKENITKLLGSISKPRLDLLLDGTRSVLVRIRNVSLFKTL